MGKLAGFRGQISLPLSIYLGLQAFGDNCRVLDGRLVIGFGWGTEMGCMGKPNMEPIGYTVKQVRSKLLVRVAIEPQLPCLVILMGCKWT